MIQSKDIEFLIDILRTTFSNPNKVGTTYAKLDKLTIGS
jgi:hypothetical protein